MKALKNIFIGKKAFIKSEGEYRRMLLVGLCGLLFSAMSIFNGLLNHFVWDISMPYSFAIGICGGFVVFFINRVGFHELAKHILLLTSIFFIFIFISNENKIYGAQLYLFAILVASISLFGYSKIHIWLIYAFLILASFLVAEFTDFRFTEVNVLSEAKADKIYGINFFFAFIGIIIVVYFQIKLQHKSEEHLIAKDKELEESEERFRLAVEGTDAGIWDWKNLNKDQQWWSPKFYELLGYKPDEIKANRITFKNLLAEEEDFTRLAVDLNRHLKKRAPFQVEYKFRCKDGTYKWFHGSGQAQWAGGEKPSRMVGSIVDITDKKLWEEEIKEKNELLQKTNAELDRFVYSVSHDLRAPLNSIQGLINIADTTNDQTELKQLMVMMKTRVKKLYTFIDVIISFARNTRTALKKEEVNLFNMATEVINNVQYREQAATIDFRLDIDKDTVVTTDISRLNIIMNNLVDNAIKYHRHAQSGKFVAISVGVFDKIIKLEITDNGQGIPEAAQEKIFDMFYRASESSKGSGLGLFIVKDMVERLGGQISLNSNYGEGTTFIINLPKV